MDGVGVKSVDTYPKVIMIGTPVVRKTLAYLEQPSTWSFSMHFARLKNDCNILGFGLCLNACVAVRCFECVLCVLDGDTSVECVNEYQWMRTRVLSVVRELIMCGEVE